MNFAGAVWGLVAFFDEFAREDRRVGARYRSCARLAFSRASPMANKARDVRQPLIQRWSLVFRSSVSWWLSRRAQNQGCPERTSRQHRIHVVPPEFLGF